MSGMLAGKTVTPDNGAADKTKVRVTGHPLDQLLIDLNLRLLSGQAERKALEASAEQAGLLVDDEGRVTLLRLP